MSSSISSLNNVIANNSSTVQASDNQALRRNSNLLSYWRNRQIRPTHTVRLMYSI